MDPEVRGRQRAGLPRQRGTPPPTAARAELLRSRTSVKDDAVHGAVAVLTVSAVLIRYATDVARRRRTVLPRLPFVPASVRRRGLPGTVAQVLAHPASSAVRAMAALADEVVPLAARGVLARLDVPALVREYVDLDRLAALLDVDAVADRVDIDRVLDRVDLDAVVARVDIDRVLDRVDLDAVVARVDIDRVLDRVDLDAVVARVDIERVLDRLDLDAIAARLDLDTLVDKVDIARVLDRVDLDAVVATIDLDRAVDRVDVDRVIARTDLAGLARYVVEEIDLPGLLRASTGSVTSEMVRSVRDQGADADRAVERLVDRLLRRQGRRTATIEAAPSAPPTPLPGTSDDHR
jgi:hypothetical protein